MNDKSLSGLLAFLDYTADKGLMAKNTVGGRKSAVSSVLGILDPEEQGDVTAVDIDNAMARFINLEGKKYNPSSLSVYKSRTNAAIKDYMAWLADPVGFRPHASKGDKKISQKSAKPSKPYSEQKDIAEPPPGNQSSSLPHQATANVFPIPIRENVVVRIHGLPFDLTTQEARKISNVVLAMALMDT